MSKSSFQYGGGDEGLTLVELLVVISIIGLLMSTLLPALAGVRRVTNSIVCLSNLRNLGVAFACYADDYDGYAMPTMNQVDTYWWGKIISNGIDHRAGFVWPYLNSELKKKSVYECSAQRYGSYGLQGKPLCEPDGPKWITSTYGYNGYYLSSRQSGWPEIKDRPWQKITIVKSPDTVFAFADTLIDLGSTSGIKNTALLDPPYKYETGRWERNLNPTTCFRHKDKANVVFVDGHCESKGLDGGEYTSPAVKIGSVGKDNEHYVPDWRKWPTEQGRRRR